ncbi:hypothetical protein BH20ACT11_BH20ACT11_09270 [soil metagenome]
MHQGTLVGIIALLGNFDRKGMLVPSSNLIRWGGLAAMAAGLAYVLEAIVFAVSPGGASQGVVSFIAVLLTAAGLVGFHALQKENYGRIGRGGFYTAIVGALVQAVAVLVSLLSEGGYLEGPLAATLFPIGFLVLMVGLIIYGAATLQARVLPRWCGIGFIVFPLMAFVPWQHSSVISGLIFLALGYVLWSRGVQ